MKQPPGSRGVVDGARQYNVGTIKGMFLLGGIRAEEMVDILPSEGLKMIMVAATCDNGA